MLDMCPSFNPLTEIRPVATPLTAEEFEIENSRFNPLTEIRPVATETAEILHAVAHEFQSPHGD